MVDDTFTQARHLARLLQESRSLISDGHDLLAWCWGELCSHGALLLITLVGFTRSC